MFARVHSNVPRITIENGSDALVWSFNTSQHCFCLTLASVTRYRESLDLCDGTVRECVDAVNTREWRHETYTRLCTEATEYARKVDSGDIKLKMDDVTFHTPTKEVHVFLLTGFR